MVSASLVAAGVATVCPRTCTCVIAPRSVVFFSPTETFVVPPAAFCETEPSAPFCPIFGETGGVCPIVGVTVVASAAVGVTAAVEMELVTTVDLAEVGRVGAALFGVTGTSAVAAAVVETGVLATVVAAPVIDGSVAADGASLLVGAVPDKDGPATVFWAGIAVPVVEVSGVSVTGISVGVVVPAITGFVTTDPVAATFVCWV